MSKPVNITIGATLASSFGQAIRGAQGQMSQLGSVMTRLGARQAGIEQFQKLKDRADQMG